MHVLSIKVLAVYICICKGITDSAIREAVATGKSFKTLKRELGLSAQCGTCVVDAIALVKQEQLQYQARLSAVITTPAMAIPIKQVA